VTSQMQSLVKGNARSLVGRFCLAEDASDEAFLDPDAISASPNLKD
jgi:hypothetical protein